MAIEKAFGVLKRRFPALKTEVRLVDPTEICKLIHSAFILHNICLERNDGTDELAEDLVEVEQEFVDGANDNYPQNPNLAGQHVQDELCRLI